MARRRKVEEHVNHERWLVSYADFITLLFAFFVVMYSISSVNTGKYRVFSDTLESEFSKPTNSPQPIIEEAIKSEAPKEPEKIVTEQIEKIVEVYTPPTPSKKTIQTIKNISDKLHSKLVKHIDNEDVIIKEGKDWLELEIKSRVLFYSGEARLGKSAVPIIGKISDILRSSQNLIQVEGFTDNNPINTLQFPSNWELSAARAASVVHLLDRYGLDPERLSAIGYGQFKPIASNKTEKGRNDNRRVVLVILGDDKNRRTINVYQPSLDKTKLLPSSINKPEKIEPKIPKVISPAQIQ